jgi:hypothetical protein
MGTKSMCWLLNTALDNLRKIKITEPAILTSLQPPESPILRLSPHQLMSINHHKFLVQIRSHVINILEFRESRVYNIRHPFVIGSREGCVPMVENGKFDRNDVSCSSLDSLAGFLDLSSKVE